VDNYKCKCGAKFPDIGNFEAHRRMQKFSLDHYRVNNRGQEYVDGDANRRARKSRTGISPVERQNNLVARILQNNKMRIYIDIDEVSAVTIYIEGSDDERVFHGTYRTVDLAIAAAHKELFHPSYEDVKPYISKIEAEVCGVEAHSPEN